MRSSNPGFIAGYQLAIALIDELESDRQSVHTSSFAHSESFDDGVAVWRDKPQDNFVLRYLDKARAHNNREVEEGFAAILSDFLCTVVGGTRPPSSEYLDLIEKTHHLELSEVVHA